MPVKIRQKGVAAALVLASMAGGAVGATVFAAGSSSAASNSTTDTQGTTGPSGAPDGAPYGAQGRGPGGKFVPNENATHEKSESAQREAQENAGQFPTVP
jgi:hypothetical protein